MSLEDFANDAHSLINYIKRKSSKILFSTIFLSFFGLSSTFIPELLPIVLAAALILPFRFLLHFGTVFDESSWRKPSPILSNIHNHRFAVVAIIISSVSSFSWYLQTISWKSFGTVAFIIGITSILALIWSEALYEKNYYFNRWHLVERSLVISFAGLSVISPAFVPLFLFAHGIIARQFRHPEGVAKFQWTHTNLPYTILLVISSFVVVGSFITVLPQMVFFLLLCGFAANYFYPGITKVQKGDLLYYIFNNNPVFMGLNAHKIGWASFLNERIVAKIGKLSYKIKPFVNIFVLFIQIGMILIVFSHTLAVAFGLLALILHSSILLTTGDNFWKWMTVDASLVLALIFISAPEFIIFENSYWFVISIGFIVFAGAWMHPLRLGWLDSPYVEYFTIQATLDNGDKKTMNANIFRPYDHNFSRGCTGAFKYLGERPRITHSHGNDVGKYGNKNLHGQLNDLFIGNATNITQIENQIKNLGKVKHDSSKEQKLEDLIRSFFNNPTTNISRHFSSPREFYSTGVSERDCRKNLTEVEKVCIFRIDGVWTTDGFNEISRKKVLSLSVE